MERKLQIITWNEIREQFQLINSELCNIIDEIDPDNSYKLIKIDYSFGDQIIKDGVLQLPVPNTDILVPYTDNQINKELQNMLSYSAIPLFMPIDNSIEVFIETLTRIIPLNLFKKGSLLGLFEILNSKFTFIEKAIWNVSAGARSLFLLPKISNAGKIAKLMKHYDLRNLRSVHRWHKQWYLFVDLINNKVSPIYWKSTIILFSKKWFDVNNYNNQAWGKFERYLFKQGWNQIQFAVNKVESSLNWETFSSAIENKKLKVRNYLIEHVKHIISMQLGKAPGFRPANNNSQSIGPIRELQNIFINDYELEGHYPTFMHMCPTDTILCTTEPIYYSMSYPTLLEGCAISKQTASTIENLRKVKYLLDILLNSIVYKGNQKYNLTFFHTENDEQQLIYSSSKIPEDDTDFINEKYSKYRFCNTSNFWNGCIKIQNANLVKNK